MISPLSRGLVRALASVALLSVTLGIEGCLTPKPQPPPPPKLAFSWEPQTTTATAGTMVIAIADAELIPGMLGTYKDASYLLSFRKSLSTDLQRALVAKGLKVTGAVDGVRNMTFPEKKATDLALVPKIGLEVKENYIVDSVEPQFGLTAVKRQGQMSAHGFVELSFVEPLSEQLMWVRKIEFTGVSENILVDLWLQSDGRLNPYHENKDNRDTALIGMLNEAYPRTLDTFWKYLDSEEMAHLATEAQDAKRRKGY